MKLAGAISTQILSCSRLNLCILDTNNLDSLVNNTCISGIDYWTGFPLSPEFLPQQ